MYEMYDYEFEVFVILLENILYSIPEMATTRGEMAVRR
jgi:hypothetical protein